MNLIVFKNISAKEKSESLEKLIHNSSPSQDFFLMVILAILMATFGLLINSMAVIIGSMLIAPILYPILGCAMGIAMSDNKLVGHSVLTILKAVVFSIISSFAVTLLFLGQSNGVALEILALIQPSLIHAAVAVIAGFAVSFALVKSDLNENLPGVAISVSLIPPLALIGIGVAKFDWFIVSSAILLFIINAAGIIFASMLVFSMMNFYVKRKEAGCVLEKEVNEIKKEEQNNA